MKCKIIRGKMAEDVIQKVLSLRKDKWSHTVSTQSMIEDICKNSIQLYVMTTALFQDVS